MTNANRLRRDRPIGTVRIGNQTYSVMPDITFVRTYLEQLTRDVDNSDGAAPGGVDAVTFAAYPFEPKSCIAASYPAEEKSNAVAASYGVTGGHGGVSASYTTHDQGAAVRADYGGSCGAVTLARYT